MIKCSYCFNLESLVLDYSWRVCWRTLLFSPESKYCSLLGIFVL